MHSITYYSDKPSHLVSISLSELDVWVKETDLWPDSCTGLYTICVVGNFLVAAEWY